MRLFRQDLEQVSIRNLFFIASIPTIDRYKRLLEVEDVEQFLVNNVATFD